MAKSWVFLWPDAWRSDTSSILGIYASSWEERRFHPFPLGRGVLLEPSASGLFEIPRDLRPYLRAKPPFTAVLLGRGDAVEIWAEDNFYVGLQFAIDRATHNPEVSALLDQWGLNDFSDLPPYEAKP